MLCLQLRYMMVMIGYPDFLLKPEAIDKEYEVRGAPGPLGDVGTWRGKVVPTSALESAETRMGRCHPKTSHLLVAHCATHMATATQAVTCCPWGLR